ncbi:MAG: choice-of-anchor Q domain-containing protein [Archangium sp.]|nr:choice-of-anchor Q domain-containing protein [Archangium sp.]
MLRILPVLLAAFLSTPALAATLTVTTPADELNADGDCSLREAVQAANSDAAVDACGPGSVGADTILLPAGTYVLTLTGASEDANATGDLDITQPLTLAKTGSGTVTLDGNLTDRIVHVLGGAVTLSGLTLTRGRPPNAVTGSGQAGGAVLNAGTLTVSGCAFSSNTAGRGKDDMSFPTHGGAGGAISSSGALSVTDSSFGNNAAGRGGDVTAFSNSNFPGDGGPGGAISSTGAVVVTRSTFTQNTAGAAGAATMGGTGGFFASGGLGGGIASQGAGTTLTVVDSSFSGNLGGPSSGFINHGGGIAKTSGNLTVRGSTFTANSGQLGGGVFSTGATVTMVNSTFLSNTSTLRGGGFANDSGPASVSSSTFYGNKGGGVATQLSGTLTLKGSLNAGNRNVADTGYLDCEALSAQLVSAGSNLLGSGTGCTAAGSDQAVTPSTVAGTVVSTMLASNGGPTQTLALPSGSPAIDLGSCTDVAGAVVATDQRGLPRPADGCDVGAFETNVVTPIVLRVSPEPAGASCAAGGQRLQFGQDDGGGGGVVLDGVLQDGEVDQTQYLCNGADGFGALVATTAVMNGDATCPAGGVKVESGRDDDRDGTLQPAEVDATSYACNGEPGAAAANGRSSLSKLTVLAVGDTHCAFGGAQLDVGLDDDGDGGLAATEIDSTAYLCTSAPGRSALTKLTVLAAGDTHCAAGGTQLEVGVDDDGDGSLSAAEVDTTAWLCNGLPGAAGPAGPQGVEGEAGQKGGCQAAPGALVMLAALVLRRRRR